MTRPDQPVKAAARQMHWGRRALVTVAAVVAVFAATGAGYMWTQTQYFVGQHGQNVALFRGVNARLGPLSLYSVVQDTDLGVSSLTPAARNQVQNGITAHSKEDGQQILSRLNAQIQPPCPTVTPVPSSTPTHSATPSAHTTSHSTTHRSTAGTARPPAPSTHAQSTHAPAARPSTRAAAPSSTPRPSSPVSAHPSASASPTESC
jgi:protein phosphatase